MALPVNAHSTDRRQDIVRLLSDVPEGLSDGDLARRLGGSEVGVRPQTVNHLCRRMVADGLIERVGSRPIRNRLVPTPAKPRRRRKATSSTTTDPAPTPAAEPAATSPEPGDEPAPEADDAPAPESEPAPAPATTAPAPPAPPVRDVLQSWSRTVNVLAAVAAWLTGRGGTIHSVGRADGGPAGDLVVSLDGAHLHVEITGWPPDGARTHPTTIAGDWFSAAESAARERRLAHPHARIVIALPDTRRYRSLTDARAGALAGSGAEVWFVDPAGTIRTPG